MRDLGTGRPYMQLHNTSDPLAGLKPEDVPVMKEALDRVRALFPEATFIKKP